MLLDFFVLQFNNFSSSPFLLFTTADQKHPSARQVLRFRELSVSTQHIPDIVPLQLMLRLQSSSLSWFIFQHPLVYPTLQLFSDALCLFGVFFFPFLHTVQQQLLGSPRYLFARPLLQLNFLLPIQRFPPFFFCASLCQNHLHPPLCLSIRRNRSSCCLCHFPAEPQALPGFTSNSHALSPFR